MRSLDPGCRPVLHGGGGAAVWAVLESSATGAEPVFALAELKGATPNYRPRIVIRPNGGFTRLEVAYERPEGDALWWFGPSSLVSRHSGRASTQRITHGTDWLARR